MLQDDDAGKASQSLVEGIKQAALKAHGQAWVDSHLFIHQVQAPQCKDVNDLLVHQLLEAWLLDLELRLRHDLQLTREA